jgi:hypothetical protein
MAVDGEICVIVRLVGVDDLLDGHRSDSLRLELEVRSRIRD